MIPIVEAALLLPAAREGSTPGYGLTRGTGSPRVLELGEDGGAFSLVSLKVQPSKVPARENRRGGVQFDALLQGRGSSLWHCGRLLQLHTYTSYTQFITTACNIS